MGMTTSTSVALQRLIDALRDQGSIIRESGSATMAQCPAHDDNNPSLSIGERKDGRGAILKCHAGCSHLDVLAALDLTESDLFDDDDLRKTLAPTQTYTYRNGRKNHRGIDAEGKKTFWQEGSGDKSLYAVDLLKPKDTVYLCEGEKAADFLRAMGFAAVATGGSQRTCDLDPLAGHVVIIIADRDDAGRKWARRYAELLQPIAQFVAIFQAKVDIDKADIVEHVAAGYGIDELEPIPLVEPTNGHELNGHEAPKPIGRQIQWQTAAEIKDAVPVWAWEYDGKGRIQLGTLALFAGRPGAGKSTAARWFAAQATRGLLEGRWHDQPQQVAYIATAEESTRYTITPGLRAAGADLGKIHYPSVYHDGESTQLLSILDEQMLIDYLLTHGITIVVVDPLMSTISAASDVNKNNEVRAQIQPWARIADAINGIVIGVAHLRKNNTGDVVSAVTGSSAFGEVARAIFGFAKNPMDDTRVMSQHKNSTGYEDLSLAYEIVSAPVVVSTGETADFGTFKIIGPSEITVEDILVDHGANQSGPGIECQRWLADYLSVEGPARSRDVKKEAAKEGFSERTVERAAKKLKLLIESKGFPRTTYWSVQMVTDPTQSRHSGDRE
jgi:hypothetical protein